MFYYPTIELTDYEKQFVRLYENGNKPGVLRRTYGGILNTEADPLIPEMMVPHASTRIQISRRSRVFMLSFAGDCTKYRLHISKTNGEHYTATNPGAPQQPSDFPTIAANGLDAPIVAAMCPGALYSPLSALGVPAVDYNPILVGGIHMATPPDYRLPVVIDPNWQLASNDILLFQGYPIVAGPLVLEIAVHVWEFPDWEGC